MVNVPRCPACGKHLNYPSRYRDFLRCQDDACPDPTAALRILSEPTIEHLVVMHPNSFSIKHPLRERLDNALLDCAVGEWVSEFGRDHLVGGLMDTGSIAALQPGVCYEIYEVGEGEDWSIAWDVDDQGNAKPYEE